MEEFKGTRGKWVISSTHNGWYRIESSPVEPTDESKANANLISAAPELLEALKYARTWINGAPASQFIMLKIDSAINKALGK